MKRFPWTVAVFVVLTFALIFGQQAMIGTGGAADTKAKKMTTLTALNQSVTAYAGGGNYYQSLQLVPAKTAASVVSSRAAVTVSASNDGRNWTFKGTYTDLIAQGVGDTLWHIDLGGAKAVKCQLVVTEADSVTVTPWLLEVEEH